MLVGLRGNETAARLAEEEEAVSKERTHDLMFFSTLKPLTAKYTPQVWQKEWDKRHEILPKLSGKLLSFCNTRKEETDVNRLHMCHSYLTHCLILKRRKAEPTVSVACDTFVHSNCFCCM